MTHDRLSKSSYEGRVVYARIDYGMDLAWVSMQLSEDVVDVYDVLSTDQQ
jgi:hypothetical protein